MSTVAITADALELMTQQNVLTKEMIGVVQTMCGELREFKGSISKPVLFDEHEAADYIGMSAPFLRKSRSEGRIGNRTPPPGHLEIGGAIRYEKKELDRWIAEDLPRKHYKGGDHK